MSSFLELMAWVHISQPGYIWLFTRFRESYRGNLAQVKIKRRFIWGAGGTPLQPRCCGLAEPPNLPNSAMSSAWYVEGNPLDHASRILAPLDGSQSAYTTLGSKNIPAHCLLSVQKKKKKVTSARRMFSSEKQDLWQTDKATRFQIQGPRQKSRSVPRKAYIRKQTMKMSD